MGGVNLDYSMAYPFFEDGELGVLSKDVVHHHKRIHEKHENQLQDDCLGWVDYPKRILQLDLQKIKQAAECVKKSSDILLVIGIGGSYLGARAAFEALQHSFHNNLSKESRSAPQLYFVGNNQSAAYMNDLVDLIQNQDFSINVISKSGTTLEPFIAFRIFRRILEEKYGKQQAKSRIYVTTDHFSSPLNTMAETEGYETFIIPANIGGRFSILTAAGLFPMAVSGICIEEMIRGAVSAREDLNNPEIAENQAYQYAAIRNALYRKDKTIEIFVSYEPGLSYLAEWWKQLFAESEGKDHKGIFPATAIYSTDLHSMGQYVQDGRRNLFETVLAVKANRQDVVIKELDYEDDGLTYLNGKTLAYINSKTMKAVQLAHTSGGVPNIVLEIPKLDAYHFGYLVYFLKIACAMSGYLMGVNPFDQPGVEAYKKNLFSALKRPVSLSTKMK